MFEKYTADELADAFVFRSNLAPEQQDASNIELKEARAALKREQTPEQKIYMNLLRLKFQMEDYIKSEVYNPEYSFGHFLKIYIDTLGKLDREFAADIDITKVKLSHILNSRRSPDIHTIIRLELHSNNLIPAINWIRILEIHKEHEIMTNKRIRREESKHVKNRFEFVS